MNARSRAFREVPTRGRRGTIRRSAYPRYLSPVASGRLKQAGCRSLGDFPIICTCWHAGVTSLGFQVQQPSQLFSEFLVDFGEDGNGGIMVVAGMVLTQSLAANVISRRYGGMNSEGHVGVSQFNGFVERHRQLGCLQESVRLREPSGGEGFRARASVGRRGAHLARR